MTSSSVRKGEEILVSASSWIREIMFNRLLISDQTKEESIIFVYLSASSPEITTAIDSVKYCIQSSMPSIQSVISISHDTCCVITPVEGKLFFLK